MINILVVDDEKHQNNVICSYLIKNNFNAIGCLNTNDAYDVMYDNHIDLIISDIMMPGIDGFEFAKSVRDIDKNIPLLFLTAKDDIQSKLRGFSLEIDDYLVKPVQQILNATKKIINGDFNVRIEPMDTFGKRNELDIIIDNFNEMAGELGSIETLRTDFISNVSHELKTPLSIIQNYSALMQDERTTDLERKEYSKSIYETSQNLSNLITNILKLNKLENQKIFLETSEYNLSEQLIECLLCFESIWEEKNINIDVDIEEDLMLNADKELTSIIWNNLYSNAFKFTEDSGEVSINAKSENNFIIVSISDKGCGMSKDTGKHIFEKFYQGDTSHATNGNGLGLALVKRIIDIMNADIYIESTLGKGTTFTVKLDLNKNKIYNI